MLCVKRGSPIRQEDTPVATYCTCRGPSVPEHGRPVHNAIGAGWAPTLRMRSSSAAHTIHWRMVPVLFPVKRWPAAPPVAQPKTIPLDIGPHIPTFG